jgi:multidrug resistance efflux pump
MGDDLSRIRLNPKERRAKSVSWYTAVPVAGVGGAIALALWLTLTFARGDDGREKNAPRQASVTAERNNAKPSRAREEGNVVAGGYVEARRSAIVYPGRDGVVAEVHVRPGQRLKKGELLLELVADTAAAEVAMAEADLALMNARLQQAKAGPREEEVEQASADADAATADWEDARRELNRIERLSSEEAASSTELDSARYEEKSKRARADALRARERLLRRGTREEEILAAEAQVARADAAAARAKAQFDLSRLRAPFDCTVVRIDLEPGEVVSMLSTQAGQPGIEIADVSELRVRIDVPEDRIARVRIGAPAEVIVDALSEERLKAEVVEIAPVADRQSNTIEVAVRVIDPPVLLCPNMSARVTITAGDD